MQVTNLNGTVETMEQTDQLDESTEDLTETETEEETLPTADDRLSLNEPAPSLMTLSSDDEDNDFELAILPDEVRRAKREAAKPDIDWMEDAIDWDAPTPSGVGFPLKKGDYVIIERPATCLPEFGWLDTRVYRLTHDPAEDGTLKLWDPVRQHQAYSNWKQGILDGAKFKRPPRGVNPERVLEGTGKVRRRRKVAAPAAPVDPNAPKRGRGRPKGSKNRPKEVIEAEKAAKREEQRQKQARRRVRA